MTLPRELTVKDDILYQWPVREIENYRTNLVRFEDLLVTGVQQLAGVEGRHIDMDLTVELNDAQRFEIKVMKGENQETTIAYDVDREVLSFDRRQSGSGIEGLNYREMPVPLKDGKLSLRILMDTYSVELFAQQGAHTMTSTVYADLTSTQVEFASDKEVKLTINKWDLAV